MFPTNSTEPVVQDERGYLAPPPLRAERRLNGFLALQGGFVLLWLNFMLWGFVPLLPALPGYLLILLGLRQVRGRQRAFRVAGFFAVALLALSVYGLWSGLLMLIEPGPFPKPRMLAQMEIIAPAVLASLGLVAFVCQGLKVLARASGLRILALHAGLAQLVHIVLMALLLASMVVPASESPVLFFVPWICLLFFDLAMVSLLSRAERLL